MVARWMGWTVAAAFVAVGCGGVHASRTALAPNLEFSYCPPAADIELYLTDPPPRPYTELALIKVEGMDSTSDAEFMARLRQEAAAVCAEAVTGISHGVEEDDVWFWCSDCDDIAPVVRGVAIRYPEEPEGDD
jgi:hypothetical protein